MTRVWFYETWTLPHYVKKYFGFGYANWKLIRLTKLERGVYSLYHETTGHAIIVSAPNVTSAKIALRQFVCAVYPKTDKRLTYWSWT